jgi:hypothetical protein
MTAAARMTNDRWHQVEQTMNSLVGYLSDASTRQALDELIRECDLAREAETAAKRERDSERQRAESLGRAIKPTEVRAETAEGRVQMLTGLLAEFDKVGPATRCYQLEKENAALRAERHDLLERLNPGELAEAGYVREI